MTKKERVLAAFNNQPVDKIPMGFWYHFSPDDDFGQETVNEHLKWYKDADLDFIKIMGDGYFNYPNPFIQTVTCADDWFNMTPLGEDHPWITKQIERAKGAAEAIRIENGSLTTTYIQYLWVRQQNNIPDKVVYIPTEANLPILEAKR